jgi:anthranilate synthase component 2/para-aminobenzoate synthetase component 2
MILLIDNYDSLTYNNAQALGALGREVTVARNDVIDADRARDMAPEALVISPGPGRPENAGASLELIRALAGEVPILGVCLGHQAIGQVFGGRVERAETPVHGKTSEVFHDGKGIFQGLRNPLRAARYHSLVLPEDSIRPPLEVSAYTLDGEVMGVRHQGMMVEGVQFHPESIATGQGTKLLRNFLDMCVGCAGRMAAL